MQPAAVNHPRIAGVRSGGRRCRVQITVAPGRPIAAEARAVRSTSSSGTLPKMPHSRSRSTGTTSAQTVGSPASADADLEPGPQGREVLPGRGGELGVELDQAAGEVGGTGVTGRRRGDVATVARAERQHPDRTGTGPVERGPDLLDDDGEPLRMSAGGIVVLAGATRPSPASRRQGSGDRVGLRPVQSVCELVTALEEVTERRPFEETGPMRRLASELGGSAVGGVVDPIGDETLGEDVVCSLLDRTVPFTAPRTPRTRDTAGDGRELTGTQRGRRGRQTSHHAAP